MELAFIIYTVQVLLPSIKGVFIFMVILGGIALVIGLIGNFIRYDLADNKEDYKPWAYPFKKLNYCALLLISLIAMLIPDKETSYTILAAYGVQKVVENPTVQEIAGNSVKVLDKYMKEYLEEDKSSVKEETK